MDLGLVFAGICVLLLLLLATFFILLLYSGLFVEVDVGAGSPAIGQVVIAYKFARGPYKKVGPLFAQVCKLAPNNKCIGIYYDDPHKVEAKRLRYAVGCVLAEGEGKVDEEQVKRFEAEGFKMFQLPRVDNMVRTSFPFVTTLSIFIAVHKVYPKMTHYVQEHSLCAHPFLEVYDGKTMNFLAPLSRQGDFYVPEALQHFEGEQPYESFYSDESQDFSQSELSLEDVSQTEASIAESSQADEREVTLEGDSVAAPTGDEEGRISDKESTSSFEEVKMDPEGVKSSSVE